MVAQIGTERRAPRIPTGACDTARPLPRSRSSWRRGSDPGSGDAVGSRMSTGRARPRSCGATRRGASSTACCAGTSRRSSRASSRVTLLDTPAARCRPTSSASCAPRAANSLTASRCAASSRASASRPIRSRRVRRVPQQKTPATRIGGNCPEWIAWTSYPLRSPEPMQDPIALRPRTSCSLPVRRFFTSAAGRRLPSGALARTASRQLFSAASRPRRWRRCLGRHEARDGLRCRRRWAGRTRGSSRSP